MSAHHEQSGSALILAIAFILAMGLGITALLSFLYAGMNASTVVRDQGGDLYAVDAAVETVIARLRMDKKLGIAGVPCGPFVETVGDREVTVECSPRATSRVGPGGPSDFPGGALVALGPAGIDLRMGGGPSTTLDVEGDVRSNGPVDVQSGSLVVTGSVLGASCPGAGTVVAIPPGVVDCAATGAAMRPAPEPSLPLPALPPPAAPTGSYCNDARSVPPGTYTNAADWDTLVGNCDGIVRFEGVYFLNFSDKIACKGNASQWCIDDEKTTMLAGVPHATSNECSGTGAVFVLGGDTRIKVLDGRVNLCGYRADADAPLISVYASASPPGDAWGVTSCRSGCTILEVDRPKTSAAFRGTVYTPDSHVELNPLNNAAVSTLGGIIGDSISIDIPTLQNPNGFVVALNGGAGTSGGLVDLVAKLDGRSRLTTTVELPDGSTPTAATVSNWTIG